MERSTSSAVNDSRKYTTLTLPPKIVSGIYLILTVSLQLNLMLSVYYGWHDFIKRLITIKDMILTCFCYMSFARVIGRDTTMLCEYVEDHISSINIDKSRGSEGQIILNRERKIGTTDKIIKRYYCLLVVVCGLLPYLQSLKVLPRADYLIRKPRVIFLMNVHYPEEYRSLFMDLIVQTFLLVWYCVFLYYWITDLKAMSLSFQCITTEMELLRNSIEEMDAIIENHHLEIRKPSNIDSQLSNTIILQSYVSGIVKSHQLICSRMGFFNINLKNLVVFLMNVYAIQLCLFLIFVIEGYIHGFAKTSGFRDPRSLEVVRKYSILKTSIYALSDIFSKVRYLLRYSIILSLVFFISVDGEKVTSEGEKLRKALWMCSWTDKPNWFKKSLLTMMTRTTVDLKIRPFTLYSLDLTCFTQIVKGTYSYFNIYKSLKKW